ncbi:MAG: hypothetical protein PVF43_16815, partial [Candidatus Eiseniibacteriota bacterium]
EGGRASGGGRTALPPPTARFDREALVRLLAGPLGHRYRTDLARLMQMREVRTVDELARCLAIEARPAAAPSAALRVQRDGETPARTIEVLFHEDLARLLREEGGLEGAAARDLVQLTRGAHGAALAPLRRRFEHGAVERGCDPAAAERLFSTLCRLAPHVVPRGLAVARAAVHAALAALSVEAPCRFVAALLDQARGRTAHFSAAQRWAAEQRIAIEPPDLQQSGVLTAMIADAGGRRRVRLGLVHLDGMSRVAAAIVVAARGGRRFGDRADLVRRLEGRLPDRLLRRLVDPEGTRATPVSASGELALAAPDGGSPVRPPRIAGRPVAGPSRRRAVVRTSRSGGQLSATLTGGLQTELFAGLPDGGPPIYSPAMARFGIVSVERAAAMATGRRAPGDRAQHLRVVGEIQPPRGLEARRGRQLATSELIDGRARLALAIVPSLLGGARELPVKRPVVVEGRLALRDGHAELMVERAIPVEMLDRSLQPELEIVLPADFRRLRALRTRLQDSPGRSRVRIRRRESMGGGAASNGCSEEIGRLAALQVTADGALLTELEALLGRENVHVVGRARSDRSLPRRSGRRSH